MTGFDPLSTFVHIADDGRATTLDVTPTFWQMLAERDDLQRGLLVSSYRFTGDWSSWERHPHGDELVVQLEGETDFVLEEPDGERTIALRGRGALVVPRNVWHTARVRKPSVGLFVTRGEGTEHRPTVGALSRAR